MKRLPDFNEYLNESSLNEMKYPGRPKPILSLGKLNLKTGKCKYFNIYDEWENDDMTCEFYKALDRSGKSSTEPNKFVFTSGTKPIGGIKPGEMREFKHDQTGRFLFTGEFVGHVQLKDLKAFANTAKSISGTGYVYK